MGVFDHVTISASDREASERFYGTVLATLGIDKTGSSADFAEWDDLSVATASAERPVTRRLHIGFVAPSRAHVDEFSRAGRAAGYRNDGAPGPRPQYKEDYYGSFLLDPDGNSAEAVHHDSLRAGGNVDHLWLRVSDFAASAELVETIAPYAGLRVNHDAPERVRVQGVSGSFSVLPGEPTEHVHIALAASRDATYVIDPAGFTIELVSRGR
jgi:catechol 2,3-dioxygenase-like lactoylglutathione lyase family enzyme